MSDLRFKGMTLLFSIRDFIRPQQEILEEAELQPGFQVLDFGCGPGSYAILTAKQVGATGRVYAVDIQPLAVRHVQTMAARQGLTNIVTIQSDGATGLPEASIDVILLYDIFHMFSDPRKILAELQRVLKPAGRLSINDHHMQERDILAGVTGGGYFKLLRKGKRTYTFIKP